jgi:UDP-N-acetyl-D-mannosaminuronic acid transferase (WecB/TagA/CpsF family)
MLQQPHKWRRYLIGNPKFLMRVARTVRQNANRDGTHAG